MVHTPPQVSLRHQIEIAAATESVRAEAEEEKSKALKEVFVTP